MSAMYDDFDIVIKQGMDPVLIHLSDKWGEGRLHQE
jgi:hypothetical protein